MSAKYLWHKSEQVISESLAERELIKYKEAYTSAYNKQEKLKKTLKDTQKRFDAYIAKIAKASPDEVMDDYIYWLAQFYIKNILKDMELHKVIHNYWYETRCYELNFKSTKLYRLSSVLKPRKNKITKGSKVVKELKKFGKL